MPACHPGRPEVLPYQDTRLPVISSIAARIGFSTSRAAAACQDAGMTAVLHGDAPCTAPGFPRGDHLASKDASLLVGGEGVVPPPVKSACGKSVQAASSAPALRKQGRPPRSTRAVSTSRRLQGGDQPGAQVADDLQLDIGKARAGSDAR